MRICFLRFVGLENYPAYREGGRLQNYLPKAGSNGGRIQGDAGYGMFGGQRAGIYLKKNPQFVRDDAGKLALLVKLAKRDDLREAL